MKQKKAVTKIINHRIIDQNKRKIGFHKSNENVESSQSFRNALLGFCNAFSNSEKVQCKVRPVKTKKTRSNDKPKDHVDEYREYSIEYLTLRGRECYVKFKEFKNVHNIELIDDYKFTKLTAITCRDYRTGLTGSGNCTRLRSPAGCSPRTRPP